MASPAAGATLVVARKNPAPCPLPRLPIPAPPSTHPHSPDESRKNKASFEQSTQPSYLLHATHFCRRICNLAKSWMCRRVS